MYNSALMLHDSTLFDVKYNKHELFQFILFRSSIVKFLFLSGKRQIKAIKELVHSVYFIPCWFWRIAFNQICRKFYHPVQ